MKRNKSIALAVAMMLAVTALLGCGGKPALAAMVGDMEITVDQLINSYRNGLSYASSSGYDTSTDEGIAQFRDYLLNDLIKTAMKVYQAKKAGVVLNDEEVAAAQTTADQNYDDMVQQFVDQATKAGASNPAAYSKTLLTKALVQNKTTVKKLQARMLEDAVNNALVSKHRTALLEGVTLTADELLAKYDEELASQKAAFDKTPSQYFTYETYSPYNYTAPPVYVPAGFFRVRQILVEDELTARMIKKELNSGNDFETLLKQYNTDPGIDSADNAAGYLVGEGASYVESFLTAALALTQDGQVSEPVQSDYGWHIIKRVSTEPAHEIPYAEVQTAFDAFEQMLEQQQYYSGIVDGWMEDETLITRYPENYASVGKS
jgi:parvulin-like peptidyl-prolyl isomerase